MKQTAAAKPIIVPENGGAVVNAFGDRITFKLTAAETGGAISPGLGEVPPGVGPALHYHQLP